MILDKLRSMDLVVMQLIRLILDSHIDEADHRYLVIKTVNWLY